MPYRLIKGEFHVHYPDLPLSGPEPDGDTIKFLPDNPSLVDALSTAGRGAAFNRRGMINLRFEGIDALETHFGESHQNLNWAEAARDELLARIGFTNIEFAERNPNKIASIDNHPQRGYVLANNLDTFGRIIAFVYAGDAQQVDGAQLFIEEAHVEASLNYQLLEAGLAYPAFYTSLPADLRIILAQLVRDKRQEGTGLWPEATANTQQTASFTEGLAEMEELVLWPKLFRRLVSYVGTGFTTLAQLDTWLREDPVNRDDRVLLPSGELGNMHDIIDVVAPLQLRMNYEPEDLVIVPDGEIVLPLPPPVKPSIGKNIRIVAALVNPGGKETGEERVTLLNVSPHDQDIRGWTIADGISKSAPLTELLNSDIIAAGDVAQVTLDSRVRLNNTGDTITLFDSNSRMIDQISYTRKEGQEEGVTLVF